MTKLAIVAAASVALATPALAQQCAPYDAFAAAVKDAYGEVPLAEFDRDGAEGRIVVMVNPGTKTVTLILVLPGEVACAPIGGTNFRPAMPPAGKPS